MKQYIYTIIFLVALQTHLLFAAVPENSIYNITSEWTNQDGKKLHLEDLKGKNIVISMVYLKCQYSCPMTISKMKEVESHLTPDAKSHVQFILVTFDVKNDTPKAMAQYADKHHLDLKNWTFLTTTTESNVRELSTLIDFKYKALPTGEFEHSYAMIALDSEGRIIGRTDGAEMKPKEIAEVLNKIVPSQTVKK
jgi:protein SCO1/2